MLIDNFVNFVKSKGEYNVDVILDIGSRDLEQSIEFSYVYPNGSIESQANCFLNLRS